MGSVTLTYKGSVKPAKTEYLSSDEISIQCECEIDIEDADMVNEKTIKSEFEKLMAAQVKTQSAALDTWLSEKSAVIGKLSGLVDKLQKLGAPVGAAAAEYDKLSSQIKQIARTVDLDKGVEDLKTEYAKIVADWAENLQAQQPLIAAEMAVKKAAIKNWKSKKLRMRAFKVAKAVLVLAVVTVGIVACVASFGTLTPVIAGLTVGLVAISGISSLVRTGSDLKGVWNMEKRLLDQVEGDITLLANTLGKVQQVTGPFAKHAADLRNYMRDREAKVKELTMALQKQEAEFKGITTDLAKLDTLDPTGGWASDIAKRKKAAAECQKQIDGITTKLAESKKAVQYANALFDWMDALGVSVAKITAVPPSSMTQNIKNYVTSVDGVLDAADLIGGLAGAAVAVAS
jgi:chromosome segregation ATPase